MSDIIIRARLTTEGQIELIDPVPSEMERPQEVTLIIRTSETPTNAFGVPVERDADGSEIPLNPLTAAEVREFLGLWADRRDEMR